MQLHLFPVPQIIANLLFLLTTAFAQAQCPHITNSELDQTDLNFCLGEALTFTAEGIDLPPGDVIDWYISQTMGFNPYQNEGAYIGTSLITEISGDTVVSPFTWTIQMNFCDIFDPGTYFVTGILNPAPSGGCMETFTDEFQIHISCPSAVLSGDIAVCSENCPDDPGLIIFEFTGGIEAYTIDVLVTASGFPPFPITGVAFDASGQINICIGGFLPSYDPNTQTLTVPDFLIGQQITIQLLSIADDEGCVGEIEPPGLLVITLYDSPIADAGNDLSICEGSFASLDGSISGSAQTSEWITNGDGSFGNPFSLQTTYTPGSNDIVNGTVTLTLIAFEPNDGCEPDSSSIEITFVENPQADAGPDHIICSDESVQLNGSIAGGATSATWSSSGDGSFDNILNLNAVYTPGSGDILAGSVTLYLLTDDVGGQCEPAIDSMVLTIVVPPVISGPTFGSACLGDIAFLPHVVSGDVGSLLWTTAGDGVFEDPLSASTLYTPGMQDTIDGQVELTLIATDALGICTPVEFVYVLTIFSCGCPPISLEEPQDPLCNSGGELELSQLVLILDPGTWQITGTPTGTNPAIIIGDLFDAQDADPGLYTVTFTLDNPFPGCPSSAGISIEVVALPQISTGIDQTICSSDLVLLNGDAMGSTGVVLWMTSGMGVFSDPNSLTGMYTPGVTDLNAGLVTLILSGIDTANACPEVSDTMLVTFIAAMDSVLISNSATICNDSIIGSVLDLFSFVPGGDTSGTWLNLSGFPIDISDPHDVDFNAVPPATYAFQYISPSSPPCPAVMDTLFVQVLPCVCPQLSISPLPTGACNAGPGVNLDAFVVSSQPGSWSLNSVPSGSMPAILMGPFLNTTGADPGVYEAMFSFENHIDGCPDSAVLEIIVLQTPIVNAGNDTLICSSDALQVDGSSNAGVTLLQWSSSGDGMFGDASMSGTTYMPGQQDIANGSVQLTLLGADTSGICPVTQSSLILTIQPLPFAIFDTTFLTVCNIQDSGSVANFLSLITAGDATGVWIDSENSGADLTDLTLVDFDGVIPGSYQFQYTTMSAMPPCADVSYFISVEVMDCLCPDISLANPPLVICNNDSLDLSILLNTPQPGTWQLQNLNGYPEPPLVVGNFLHVSGSTPGTYWLEFTLTNVTFGCNSTIGFSFTVEAIPVVSVVGFICHPADSTFDVTLITNAEVVTADFGTVASGQGDTIYILQIPGGQDISLSLTSSLGLCTIMTSIVAPDCNCTLEAINVPVMLSLCPGDTISVNAGVTGGDVVFEYWLTPMDTIFGSVLKIFDAGIYIYNAETENGCKASAELVSVLEDISPFVSLINPLCTGGTDGSIIIESITGGVLPMLYAVNGGTFQTIDTLPVSIGGFAAGDYILTIQDAMGCEALLNLSLENPSGGFLELGPEVSITAGDSIFISPDIDFIPLNITYDPPLLQSLQGWITPHQNIKLTLEVTDSSGCLYGDEIQIFIVLSQDVYVPTLFSPNGDQINDNWTIYSTDVFAHIITLTFYDRWGGVLFNRTDIPVNDPGVGWDGTGNGKEMNPGVYIFNATVQLSNGNLTQVSGDVTLVK